jgi:hypothetical protein
VLALNVLDNDMCISAARASIVPSVLCIAGSAECAALRQAWRVTVAEAIRVDASHAHLKSWYSWQNDGENAPESGQVVLTVNMKENGGICTGENGVINRKRGRVLCSSKIQ